MQHAKILDGRALASARNAQLQAIVNKLQAQIQLCVILVGDNPASAIYVQQKQRAFASIGMQSRLITMPAAASQHQLLEQIEQLNHDSDVHGILVQLPLPEHMDSAQALQQVSVHKDVDCFHPYNVGLVSLRTPLFRPCTPFGIIVLLKHFEIALKGQHAVVVGASNIVGRPMALELLTAGSTVTVCHRFTKALPAIIAQADIVIAAAGKPNLIEGAWLKQGAVVVDVGINKTSDGLCGDVDFKSVNQRASWISPVPGGVGPMTVHCLMANTLLAYCQTRKLSFSVEQLRLEP